MNYQFRKALSTDIPTVWNILHQAILRRKEDGSEQWQDGYPNPDVIKNDIENNFGYVLSEDDELVGYCALLINDEPEYEKIIGEWLSNKDFVVFHRVAIAATHLGKGLAKKLLLHIEEYALSQNIKSIKSDTNFDNLAMLNLFEKAGYQYCGKVYFRGSARRAYEKLLP